MKTTKRFSFYFFLSVLCALSGSTVYEAIRTFDTEHLLISPQFMLGDYATWIDYIDIYAEYFDDSR